MSQDPNEEPPKDELGTLLHYLHKSFPHEVGEPVYIKLSEAELRLMIAGLEELEADQFTRGAIAMRFSLAPLPAGVERLGAEWPEALRHASRAYAVALRIGVVSFRDTANSELATFLTSAAAVARDNPEVARLIGARMR